MSRGGGGRPDRRGSVLVVAVLVTLALELLAHGALLMARQELGAARAGLRVLRARAAAEAGVWQAADRPVSRSYREQLLWAPLTLATTSLGSAEARSRLRRLSREGWLVEGRGRVGAGPWTAEDAGTAWLPDPAARVAAFGAVVEVGVDAPVSILGRVETDGLRRDLPPLDPGPCDEWLATLDSLFPAGTMPAWTRRSMGPEPSLGRLGPDELMTWIPRDPPAADGFTAHATSSLTLTGGVTRGLLVVSGDLELDGARHRGVVLVGGRLVLRDGAVLVGLARAAGGLDVDPRSVVVGSGCRALLALDGGLGEWARPLPLRPGGIGPW